MKANSVYSSTSWVAHLTYRSWAEEELAAYEAGSTKSNDQESINLDKGRTANERKNIKAGKRRVKREVKEYEQTRENSYLGKN